MLLSLGTHKYNVLGEGHCRGDVLVESLLAVPG